MKKQIAIGIDGKLIVSLYHQNDPITTHCLQQHWEYLGRGIAAFINIFSPSPQRMVVGGGLSEAGVFYMEELNRRAFAHAMKPCAVNTRIVTTVLGNKAGCLDGVWQVNCGKNKSSISFIYKIKRDKDRFKFDFNPSKRRKNNSASRYIGNPLSLQTKLRSCRNKKHKIDC